MARLSIDHCHARRWPHSKRERGISLKDPAFSHEVHEVDWQQSCSGPEPAYHTQRGSSESKPCVGWQWLATTGSGSSTHGKYDCPSETATLGTGQLKMRTRHLSLAHSHDQTRHFMPDISRIQLATLNTGQPDPVELQLDHVNT